jgi:transglutaminase-like putative cysteine protease
VGHAGAGIMKGRRLATAGMKLTVLNGLTLCTLICAAGLFFSEATGPLHAAALAAASLYQRWRWSGNGGLPSARRLLWEVASVFALIFFLADLFVVTHNLIGSALRLLVFIVAYHADNPQSPRRARQTLGLSLIQMVAAAASTTSIAFSFFMFTYLISALWTLASLGSASRESESESRPISPGSPAGEVRVPLMRLVGVASMPIMALALGIFFVVPHYGTGYFREAGKSQAQNISGFSDTIELGSIGSIKKNFATVMRVRQVGTDAPVAVPLRMRGLAFDHYDGRAWSVTDKGARTLQPYRQGSYMVDSSRLPEGLSSSEVPSGTHLSGKWLGLDIRLEPLGTRVLFTPPELVTLTTTRFHTLKLSHEDGLFASGPTLRRFPYLTTSLDAPRRPELVDGDSPPSRVTDYRQLPELNPRITALANQVAGGITGDAGKARAIESYLLQNHEYSLDGNDQAVEPPLDRFLLDGEPGHCEYFATAMAIMARTQGLHTRVVNGFNGGEHSDLTDWTIIRQSDAHSWVEVWLPGSGWTTFDPTPPDPGVGGFDLFAGMKSFLDEAEIAWDTYIIGLDLGDQRNALEEIRERYDYLASGIAIFVWRGLHTLAGILEGPGRLLKIAGGTIASLGTLVFASWMTMNLVRFLRRWRSGEQAPHPATLIFRRFELAARKRGIRRDLATSPGAFARAAGAPDVAAAFEAARYGPEWISNEALKNLKATVRSFKPANR